MVSALAVAAYIKDMDADGDKVEYREISNKTQLSATITMLPHATKD